MYRDIVRTGVRIKKAADDGNRYEEGRFLQGDREAGEAL
jgi:hypothetical protein